LAQFSPSLYCSRWLNPYIGYWPQKVEASLYPTVQEIFRYLEPFTRGSRVKQTDRQTDRRTYRLAHSIYRAALRLAVMNAAARVVSDTRKYDRGLATLLHDLLPWLDVPHGCGISCVQRFHRCVQHRHRST